MNQNTIIGLLVAGIIVFGLGGFFLLSGDDDDSSAETETSQQTDVATNSQNGDNPLGLDFSSLGQAFRANLSSTNADGSTSTATIEVDGNGNTATTVSMDGQTTSILLVDGVTYTKDPSTGQWFSFPSGSETGGVEAPETTGIFAEDEIGQFNTEANVEFIGNQSCISGTCRVYRVTDLQGDRATVKIDDSTNRISEVELDSDDGTKNTITYEYDASISIVAPEGATEFTIPDFDLNSIPQ